jgi:uncharacterized protein (UPF0333 family)
MSIEFILGIIGVIAAAIMTAFGIGHSRGKSKAEAVATERETKAAIDSQQVVSKRQQDTIKGAADVQETVSRMPGSAVDDELLRDWTRKD